MPDTPGRRSRILKPGQQARRSKEGESKVIPVYDLRQHFNNEILPKVANNELTERILEDNHPSSPLAGEPVCTKSQILGYYDHNNKLVAEAHRYLRKDGKLGASGKPDPKKVQLDGIYHHIDLG